MSATLERDSGKSGKTGLKIEADTEVFFGILNADNMVKVFLSLILSFVTRSLKAGIFQFTKKVV